MSELIIKAEDVLVGDLDAPDNTLYGVVRQIMALDRNAPDFEEKLKGKFKRFYHHEKLDMYLKFQNWMEHYGVEFITRDILPIKVETHRDWIKKTDKEIWTSG